MLTFFFVLIAHAAAMFEPVLAHPHAKLDPARPAELAEILALVSAPLVGKPYKLGPLGEGHDEPLYRLDEFDCTTFVETAMANAYCYPSGNARCLERRMDLIRYGGGKISFRERNHVPETDWLPNNARRGFLADLSVTLFPGEWLEAPPTIDRELWLESKGEPAAVEKATKVAPLKYLPVSLFFRKAELTPEKARALEEKLAAAQAEALKDPDPEEEARLKFRAELAYLRAAYVPVEDKLAQIPPGTVLSLVRAPVKDAKKAKLTPLVSHQGLIVRGKDGLRLRHAAPNIGHVSDQPLADYLLRYVRSKHARGISLYRILPAVDRPLH